MSERDAWFWSIVLLIGSLALAFWGCCWYGRWYYRSNPRWHGLVACLIVITAYILGTVGVCLPWVALAVRTAGE